MELVEIHVKYLSSEIIDGRVAEVTGPMACGYLVQCSRAKYVCMMLLACPLQI
jgi:hypothetical protein